MKKKTTPSRGTPRPFDLGRVVATALVDKTISAAILAALLGSHSRRQWGSVSPASAAANDRSADKNSGRIMSVHDVGKRAVWIITEGEKGSRITTILFPDEY